MEVYSQTSNTDSAMEGEWTTVQDPDSWEIISVWKPVDTDQDEAGIQHLVIPCEARTPISSGVGALGSFTDRGERIKHEEFIRVYYPKIYRLTINDRVSNIKDSAGTVVWVNEEYSGEADIQATVFNVEGVTPIFDWNNELVEWSAVLKRVN